MHYRQDLAGVFDAAGAGGLDPEAFAKELARTTGGLDRLRIWRADGSLPLLRLPERRDDLEELHPVAERLGQFADLLLLGTGGSSLGGRTLLALDHAPAPRVHFVDNIDPHTYGGLLAGLDPARTAVLAISKSGSTAETLTQLLIALDWLRRAQGEAALGAQVVAITEPRDNPLRRLAMRFGIPVLDHDPGVGGRFSVLSLVGLLPALSVGLDVTRIREGAADVLHATLEARVPEAAEPAKGAALNVVGQRTRGLVISVLMPYVDRLADFGLWYRQLWAESLGKDGHGTTPVPALGAVDQHSQLQLYLDGPADKLFTLISMEVAGQGPRVPPDLASDPALAYLAGRTIGDLMAAEQRATEATLLEKGRPTRVFRLARLDEAVLGALLMHFMLETILTADLLGINAFDQPAVERGKVLARQYLAEMR